jgi:hypothetical protein
MSTTVCTESIQLEAISFGPPPGTMSALLESRDKAFEWLYHAHGMRIVLKPAALTESMYASVGNLLPHHVGFWGTSIVFPMFMPKPILANISFAVGKSAAKEFDANAKENALQRAATRMCCFNIVNPLVLCHSRFIPKQRKIIHQS